MGISSATPVEEDDLGLAELEALVGMTIVDRYEVGPMLGVGGMGAVFRGVQLALGRPVAIKILHPALTRDVQIAKRFEREAQSVARLEHPNIVGVVEFGTTADRGYKFIVMQLLEGTELHNLLGEPLHARRAVDFMLQILGALDHAHQHGVIHRDLKPENVFVTRDHEGRDQLKLVDFGIAKMVGEGGAQVGEAMTKLGLVFGTPAYMSPEQATGSEVDARADLYSAGIIFYQMLAGAAPFENDDPVALIRMQVALDPPPLPETIHPQLRHFVTTLLQKERDKRYVSAAEARQTLEGLLDEVGDLDDTTQLSPISPAPDRHTTVEPIEALNRALTAVGIESNEKNRIRLLVILGAAVLAVAIGVTALIVGKRSAKRDELAAGGATATGETDGDELILEDDASGRSWESPQPSEYLPIDRALTAGSSDGALDLLTPLREQFPDDPQLMWREGQALALAKNKGKQALELYDQAIVTDPSLLENHQFFDELRDLMDLRRNRVQAVEMALAHLGERGHPFLLERINETDPRRSLDYELRHRTLAVLRENERSALLIDEQLNLARDLWQSNDADKPCTAFADALDRVAAERPDPYWRDRLKDNRKRIPQAKDATSDREAAKCDGLEQRLDAMLETLELQFSDEPVVSESDTARNKGQPARADSGGGGGEETAKEPAKAPEKSGSTTKKAKKKGKKASVFGFKKKKPRPPGG